MITTWIWEYVNDRRFFYQLIFGLLAYYGIKIAVFLHDRRSKLSILKKYGIPGPKPTLISGNLNEFIASETFYMDGNEELIKKYGNYLGYFFGEALTILTTDVDFLKKVFFEENSTFTERSHVFITIPLTESILFARYHRWRVMRKLMGPPFSAFTMRGTVATRFIENSLGLMIKYIDTKFNQLHDGSTRVRLDVQDLMKSTALHLISSMAIKLPDVQVKEGDEKVKLLDSYMTMTDRGAIVWAIRFPFMRTVFQFLSQHVEHNKLLASIKRHLDSMIDSWPEDEKSRVASGEDEKIIDTLIRLHHEGKMSRTEVIGNAEALLIAGYDTTSTTLAYIFWVLSKNTDLQDRLRSELLAHGIESGYLVQIINETMRLYPTVISFVTRLANRTTKINQFVVPKGARVLHNAWVMHRSPDLWTDPLKFDPERFKEGVEISPIAFAPFGLGNRKCLGYQLAMLELKMVVCDLLLRYKFHLVGPKELNLKTYAGVVTKPVEKIELELEKL